MKEYAHYENLLKYSGGAEAYDGQGGFCGSGGSSKINPVNIRVCVDQVVAHDEDISTLARMMRAVKAIEASSKGSKDLTVEGSVEDKVKLIVTKPAFQKSLERLQYKSEPVWGLNVEEREMVMNALNVLRCFKVG